MQRRCPPDCAPLSSTLALPSLPWHGLPMASGRNRLDNWQVLSNLVLASSPYLFFGDENLTNRAWVYRITPVP